MSTLVTPLRVLDDPEMRWLPALLLILAGCATSSVESAPSSSRPEAMACGDLATPATMPLRPGAGRMLVCDSGQFPWQPPAELLRADLDGLMADISALKPHDEQAGCTADGGSGFTLMFGYPDGSVAAVSGDTGGCGVVDTGSGEYDGADELFADVIDRFAAARSGQKPPRLMSGPALDCNQGGPTGHILSLTGSLRDSARAISCWRGNARNVLPPFHVRDVSDRDLRVLARDALTHQVRRRDYAPHACDNFPRYFWQDLLIATTWGDVLVLRGICDDFLVEQAPDGGGKSTYWHPSPRAQRLLDGLRR